MGKNVGYHFWVCKCCKNSSIVFKKQLTVIEKRVTAVEKQAAANESSINKLSGSVDTLKTQMTDLNNKITSEPKEAANLAEESVFAEFAEREHKKNNLVFHNVAEAPNSVKSGTERKDADLDKLKDIMDILGVNISNRGNSVIKFCSRIGEKTDAVEENPRPLLVGTVNQEVKQDILSNARNLKDSACAHVSIVPDLTARQRKEEAALKLKADQKNEELSEEEKMLWEWKLVGPRGQRRLLKVRRRTGDQSQPRTGRGPQRKRGNQEMDGEDQDLGPSQNRRRRQ